MPSLEPRRFRAAAPSSATSHDDIVETSSHDLGLAAITPAEFVLYSDAQYRSGEIPFRPFDENRTIGWVSRHSLPAREPVYVPAYFAYLRYLGHMGDHLCLSTSNGLAAGPDLDSAILSGLYELIERDGFLITRMDRLSVADIDLNGVEEFPAEIRAYDRRMGVEIWVFNATTDIPVPVMMGFAIDRSGESPSAVIGLGCSLNPIEAVSKALLEVCQGRLSETWRFRRRPSDQRVTTFRDVRKLRVGSVAHLLA